ncbi:WG repeat-containing protein [Bradyrhizobium sp. JYMT SZCCT0428]|uniref:WG repeat-containing protein n=1 Tax=Bradyrhizobium sp. JYMT SZCCT0428 TaxID=2807673 RepID=UPI001BA91165|nr:WG repeat-containing protein [Bradyrhizobium sp. JYMT SZCCT0428]MBR1152237.1 WG repeat-containing protein [Bradyrhizobium sp. JYMT SZCCT0428]
MWKAAALVAVMLATAALAQDKPPELTPAGKAILQDKLAIDGRPLYDRPGPGKPMTFPLAMCTFPGGFCGAVRRDGSVAVLPKYDWVGTFSDNRAAVRVGGLYGYVDEDGHEIVKPQYRIVDDYHFGFAQVDVDGKSGLIDRDGKMVIEPKYGFVRAIGPDRFRVSDTRWLGGVQGGEDFSEGRIAYPPSGGVSVTVAEFVLGNNGGEIIDLSGQRVGPPPVPWTPGFDKDDPSIRWVQKDKLWGLAHADGSWLIEPKFQQAGSLVDGLARVSLTGKIGFIDRAGNFAIEPVFDKAWVFERGIEHT